MRRYTGLALLTIIHIAFFFGTSFSCAAETFDLQSVIGYGLKHNPSLRISAKNIETEKHGVTSARAERMPKIDVTTGATRYRYPTPLTPIVIQSPLTSVELPDFERTIYDGGASFRLPFYRGGRIMANIRIAETKKALAEDNYATTRQDLVYNLTSVYHKILQLQKLVISNKASVRQFESHKQDVELFLKTGTVPPLDLFKTEVELAHARERLLLVKNNLDSSFELLKTLMGVDDPEASIALAERPSSPEVPAAIDASTEAALAKRPDYQAVQKKRRIAEDRIRVARGRRLPDVFASGQYTENTGPSTAFKENWYLGMRLTLPVFDGGLIRSEIDKERVELEKVKEEERAVRLAIAREVKDAHLAVKNAAERIKVTEKAIESARETVRVELLRYRTGAGTSTDVIDAQTALLRAETDYYQAAYDREVALASLRKAMGEYPAEQEVTR
jgi:outer membrane protein